MHITFGKQEGTAMEVMMLKKPGYISWLLGRPALGPLSAVKQEAKRLIHVFDMKAFAHRCCSTSCTAVATRMTVYGDSAIPVCWCEGCDPHQLGAKPGKLQLIDIYRQALAHVTTRCRMRKSSLNEIILHFARAKGLGKRVSESEGLAFFSVEHDVRIAPQRINALI